MGLRIKTNISSLNAQRQLSQSTKALRENMEKLSSGERINKAADDAAGLAVSENMKASVRSLNAAKRNANDGISVIQTAEGGLMETGSMLIRLRELAVQASSDTIGNKERDYLDKEFLQLKDEINRIAASTEFNGTRLLVGKQEMAEDMQGDANKFPLEIQVSKDYYKNSDALEVKNPVNVIKIDLGELNSFTSGEGSLQLGMGEEGSRVNSKQDAQNSLSVLDTAITKVNGYRAYLGSVQNRLNSSISNLGTRIENLSEANSRIRDTDFAEQTAELTKSNILQQAGTSILANANNQPQIALSLLQH